MKEIAILMIILSVLTLATSLFVQDYLLAAWAFIPMTWVYLYIIK